MKIPRVKIPWLKSRKEKYKHLQSKTLLIKEYLEYGEYRGYMEYWEYMKYGGCAEYRGYMECRGPTPLLKIIFHGFFFKGIF